MQKVGSQIVVVGFGPAGLAAALEARRAGIQQIHTFDPGTKVGSAGLEGIVIDSNSRGTDFTDPYEELFPKVLELDEATPLRRVTSSVNLPSASRFLHKAATQVIADGLVNHTPEPVLEIKRTPNGFEVRSQTKIVETPLVVSAPGGEEKLLSELEPRRPDRVFTSRDILSSNKNPELERSLSSRATAAIIGNSHGAYSAALVLTRRFPDVKIDFFKLSPTKPFFESVQEAERLGYEITGLDTVCADTGYVNRFDGIRGQARTLWLEQQHGRRTNLRDHYNVPIKEIGDDVAIVQATGYSPRQVPLTDLSGEPIDYTLETHPSGFAYITDRSNVPVPGAISLGVGVKSPDGTAVYHGQARKAFELAR